VLLDASANKEKLKGWGPYFPTPLPSILRIVMCLSTEISHQALEAGAIGAQFFRL
jgi:hypothetical protein